MQQIAMDNYVRKKLVLVGNQQFLEKAFARMNAHNIHSVPVVDDKTKNVIGLIDALDLCGCVADAFKEGGSESQADIRRLVLLAQVQDVIEKHHKRKTYLISQEAKMSEGIKWLAKENLQRMLILDREFPENELVQELKGPEDMVVGILSQSDILRFLAENLPWVKKEPGFQKSIEELGMGRRKPITIPTTATAADGFTAIFENDRDGLAIVDENGKLVANLCAANLKGITRRNIRLFQADLADFLMRDRRRGWWSLPICLEKTDSLEKTILQFAATKLHRMYLVDSEGKPTGEINLTDILQQVVELTK
jgi:CBS-domain-containing membrane protein